MTEIETAAELFVEWWYNHQEDSWFFNEVMKKCPTIASAAIKQELSNAPTPRTPELDIAYYKAQLKLETDPYLKDRIEKQIELLDDAILIYKLSREDLENGA